jgi:hypothetical protein
VRGGGGGGVYNALNEGAKGLGRRKRGGGERERERARETRSDAVPSLIPHTNDAARRHAKRMAMNAGSSWSKHKDPFNIVQQQAHN